MKKFRISKLTAFVSIITVVLVFLVFGIVQAQVKTNGKPPKPPGLKDKYVWSAVILNGPGYSIIGDSERYNSDLNGWVYDDSEDDVNVWVEIRRSWYGDVYKYYTRFVFEIYSPVQINIDIIPREAHFYPNTPEAMCIYPGYDSDDPMSMLYFLQDSLHPLPEYHKVDFRFYTDRSIDQNAINYEQWDYHAHMSFLAGVEGPAPMMFRPSTCEELNLFEFSHIEFGGNEYGYFERMSEDAWKVVVGMEINPYIDYTISEGEISVDDAWATDWYHKCVLTQINKKKTRATYDAIFSSQGSFDMKTEILFIRRKN